jgi:hypothetical protein
MSPEIQAFFDAVPSAEILRQRLGENLIERQQLRRLLKLAESRPVRSQPTVAGDVFKTASTRAKP